MKWTAQLTRLINGAKRSPPQPTAAAPPPRHWAGRDPAPPPSRGPRPPALSRQLPGPMSASPDEGGPAPRETLRWSSALVSTSGLSETPCCPAWGWVDGRREKTTHPERRVVSAGGENPPTGRGSGDRLSPPPSASPVGRADTQACVLGFSTVQPLPEAPRPPGLTSRTPTPGCPGSAALQRLPRAVWPGVGGWGKPTLLPQDVEIKAGQEGAASRKHEDDGKQFGGTGGGHRGAGNGIRLVN